MASEPVLSAPHLMPFEVGNILRRSAQLRDDLTMYDACYVALAEQLGVPLATLDRKLSRASGPRCEFKLPP